MTPEENVYPCLTGKQMPGLIPLIPVRPDLQVIPRAAVRPNEIRPGLSRVPVKVIRPVLVPRSGGTASPGLSYLL